MPTWTCRGKKTRSRHYVKQTLKFQRVYTSITHLVTTQPIRATTAPWGFMFQAAGWMLLCWTDAQPTPNSTCTLYLYACAVSWQVCRASVSMLYPVPYPTHTVLPTTESCWNPTTKILLRWLQVANWKWAGLLSADTFSLLHFLSEHGGTIPCAVRVPRCKQSNRCCADKSHHDRDPMPLATQNHI